MVFPPPPGLILLAYQFGSITKAEMARLLDLWRTKHGAVDLPRQEGE